MRPTLLTILLAATLAAQSRLTPGNQPFLAFEQPLICGRTPAWWMGRWQHV